jgi:hypothetical protein
LKHSWKKGKNKMPDKAIPSAMSQIAQGQKPQDDILGLSITEDDADFLCAGDPSPRSVIRIGEALTELGPLEPLHPSSEPTLACAHGYRERKKHDTESVASRRGTEIHDFLLAPNGYIAHLVDAGVHQDEEWWKSALHVANCGDDSRELLEGFLPGFTINPDQVLHLERRLYLDAEMNPTTDPTKAAISGQPDLTLLDAPARRMKITDFKSQFRIVSAEESFQGRVYSLMKLLETQFIQEVEFELAFVRYGNAKRTVIYTREHIPHLKKAVLKVRQRQVELERQIASGSLAPAVSGPHCVGCPLFTKCPIKDINPYTQQSLDDLVRFADWSKRAHAKAMEILRDAYEFEAPPVVTDGNGRTYQPEYVKRTKTFRAEGERIGEGVELVRAWDDGGNEKPICARCNKPIVRIQTGYVHKFPDVSHTVVPKTLLSKMRLSGLSTFLKANFRQPLAQQFEDAGLVRREDYTVFDIVASGMDEGGEEEEQ